MGFGLSDKRLKKSMQGWARAGNGSYYDARDSAQLAGALADAVSAPFRVWMPTATRSPRAQWAARP